jgi:uncharacterized protein (DUF1778 family)
MYCTLQYNNPIEESVSVLDICESGGCTVPTASSNLMVRLDRKSKESIAKAAELRRVSVSDYVRLVTVAQAQREVSAAEQNIIALSPSEQLEFWNALNEPPRLTSAQRELGRLMRGE